MGQVKPQVRSNMHVAITNNLHNCYMCRDASHKIYDCPLFLKLNVRARAKVVKKFRLCLNCLKPECQSFKCRS